MSITSLERDGRRTLAEELRHQLADEIMSGALVPGAALDETELVRRFPLVSRTPVRQAIRWIDAIAVSSAAASRIGLPWWRGGSYDHLAAGLIGMFEAGVELELLCAGFSAERMTGADRNALEAAHESCAR